MPGGTSARRAVFLRGGSRGPAARRPAFALFWGVPKPQLQYRACCQSSSARRRPCDSRVYNSCLRIAPPGAPAGYAGDRGTERYRSGRNGGASKASCRVSGTWVRIPPSPPTQSFAFNKLTGVVGSVRAMACDANRFFASDQRQKSQVQACSGHAGSSKRESNPVRSPATASRPS